MLRKKDVEWVKQNRLLHIEKPKKALTDKERQKYFRIRQKIKETLQGLTSILKNMPEQQLEQTFNVENVDPFLTALFSLESDDLERRRKRIKGLWSSFFEQCKLYAYGAKLLGEDNMSLLMGGMPREIEAIYIGTFFEEKKGKKKV